ncbi:MAG: hypothetical protein ACFE85_14955 [Candidatus Hodarchaeota archaeon]
MINKHFNLNWMFECPDAILTCSVLRCGDESFLVFGGHDKTLYLMDKDLNILDSITFDGWCRCSYPIDITGDGCDEILVGAGDGNFLVVKFVKGLNKLAGIMNYKTFGKVLCVSAGDFTRDGNVELILGGEDKTLKIFENIDSTEPKFILYYDSWVTACSIGYLKLSKDEDPIFGLVIGTKSGFLQLIQTKEGKPDIIWQKNLGSQINVVDIGDVTNDGFHEIVLGTDDSQLRIFNPDGDELKSIDIEEGRPISLKLEDIDGDNAKEIIVGCADGTLRVFHNPNLNSSNLELKWKTSTSSSIKIVSLMKDPQEGLTNILYGGYDRSIRCISDLGYGEKSELDIPYNIVLPKTSKVEDKAKIEDLVKIETVPTNIREYIFKILIEKRVIEGVAKDLEKRGYVLETIVEEFEKMLSQRPDSYEKVTYSIWTLPEGKIGEEGVVGAPVSKEHKKIKPLVIEEVGQAKGASLIDALRKDTDEKITVEKISATEENLRTIITHHLEKNKLIPSKTKLVDDIVILGYDETTVENLIEKLKNEGVIKYSRSEPKGWSLAN